MIRKSILALSTLISLASFGQKAAAPAAKAAAPKADKSAVIFTVDKQSVTVGEFEYVYTNNINNQADYSEKSLTDYLNLYENFRLKVREAEAMKLDTITTLKTELEGYRKQLAKSYLTDKEITDHLIQEAYERSKQEVNVSHILVGCDENANPADTLAAYKKAQDYRARLLKGEDFAKLAKESADKDKGDPSAKDNGGTIGWFTVFQTVYPFESAAYGLKAGEISNPVRTQFGYHIVKLNKTRPAQGEIHVAHILLKFSEKATDEEKAKAKVRIDSISNQLALGKLKWDDAVTAFSEDRTSKSKKGELQWFGVGRMMPEFEEAAYALKKDGDVSKPTKTNYGWHIIKRLEKRAIPPFAEVKADFKKKVERDSRSSVAKTKLIDRIKRENKFYESLVTKRQFFDAIDTNQIRSGNLHGDSIKFATNEPLFHLAGAAYTTKDFGLYLEKSAKRRNDKGKEGLLTEYYDNWVNQKCLDYEESMLDKKKPEFASLMKEYRDGILLFELTDRQVWGKATKDTTGLQAFHDQNKTKYMWKERADVEIFNCSDKKICDEANALVKSGKTGEEVQKLLNKEGSTSKVSVISGKYEKGQYDVVDKTTWKKGVEPITKINDSSYQFVFVKEIVKPEPKTLKEAKGYAVSDYQEYLEKKWLADLRQKYPIEVNQSVFKSLIKK
jgi:peptidyl-prolyl cis-trans isomerase SurA